MIKVTLGDLQDRVTIEVPQLWPDTDEYGVPSGQQIERWRFWGDRWAWLRPLQGRMLDFGKHFSETVSHQIVFNFEPEFPPVFRVIDGDHTYTLTTCLDDDNSHTWLVAYCTEVRR